MLVDNQESKKYVDALHLSISMFCCLGYGQVLPLKFKLFSSSQAIIGLSYLPLIASYSWMYIQNRLHKNSFVKESFVMEDFVNNELTMSPDFETGIFRVMEDEETIGRRTIKFHISNCSKCNSDKAAILTFVDPHDTIPLKRYAVKCPCGNLGKIRTNALCAVLKWNTQNHRK